MKAIYLIALAIILAGCEKPRHTPKEQAEDFKVCQDAGMDSYQNTYGEVLCAPPGAPRHD